MDFNNTQAITEQYVTSPYAQTRTASEHIDELLERTRLRAQASYERENNLARTLYQVGTNEFYELFREEHVPDMNINGAYQSFTISMFKERTNEPGTPHNLLEHEAKKLEQDYLRRKEQPLTTLSRAA